jgi:DNA helicase-2/ATP-dependent DNA helicase PcrA
MTTYLNDLNSQQIEAVTFAGKNLLVLAGAGSGKTKTLVTRIAHFIKSGVRPQSIIAVTFTNKAARELRERLKLLFPHAVGVHIGTFHRLSHFFLRRYGFIIHLASNFQIITPSDQKRIFKNIFIQLNRTETQYCNQKTALNVLSDYYRDKSIQFDEAWSPIINTYIQQCARDGLIDFDGLIDKATQLYTHPEFKTSFSNQLEHVLIDEFQDTSPDQFRWICELVAPGAKTTLVGDDDQSIYGFRGADVRIIQKVSHTFEDIFTIRLEQNYRSTPAILTLANHVITHNKNRLGKNLWTTNKDSSLPTIIEAADEYQEIQEVCRQIHLLLNQGVQYSEIAVLYRSNALSRLLEAEARKYHWPYRVSGGLPFFDREEIRDIMSYLQVVSDPRHNTALLRILNKPARKIGPKTQDILVEYSAQYQVSVWDAILALMPTFSSMTQKALQRFVELVQSFKVLLLSGVTLADLTHHILQETQLLVLYQNAEQSENKEDNIYEFTKALLDFQGANTASSFDLLVNFLSEYLIDDSLHQEKNSEELVFSTCHGAKGLEWPYVFLIGMEKNLFPHEHSYREDEIEEERRLFYVAITRAKKELKISYALKRQRFNEFLYPEPSPFLYDIPKECVTWIGKKNKNKSSLSTSKTTDILLKKRIYHQVFGEGEVVMIDLNQDLMTVKFEKSGIKMLRHSLAQKMIQDL